MSKLTPRRPMSKTTKTKQQLTQELAHCHEQLTRLQAREKRHAQARKALRESEKRYRDLVENSLGLICIHDLEGIVLSVNPAACHALGYQPGEGVGHSVRQFLAPSVQPFFDAYLKHIHTHPIADGIMRVLTKTGQERLWMYRNVRCEEAGRPAYVVGHAIDITEHEQAKEALQQTRDSLERQVHERTQEIRSANTALKVEIAERKKTEATLRMREGELQKSRAELQKLAGQLLFSQEEERRRLARELHDDLAQRLAALVLDVAALAQDNSETSPGAPTDLKEVQTHLSRLAEDVQHFSHQLHPAVLEHLGLVDAIQSECGEFSRREGIAVTFTPTRVPNSFSHDIALSLYRLTQEGLRNVAKHAKAKAVAITLSVDKVNLTLAIQDNGIGFDPAKETKTRGLGLTSMAERVRHINGQLSITSQPGQGTCITATIPLTGDLYATPPPAPRRRSSTVRRRTAQAARA